jgi:predicted chitinase
MLISPPFLPTRNDHESDEAYVRRAMKGDAPGVGAFPVSHQNRWHGGLHLCAPFEHNEDLDVRAIGDGILVHRGSISTKSEDRNHPLNYDGGWTSDGCVILKHDTEIGDGDDGKIEFYSIYHHLRHMPAEILAMQPGQRIWRKDVIGSAGYINGKPNLFHFEIVADDTNARRLMGRIAGDVPLGKDGRKDVCYGDMHFYLPPSTTFSDLPSNPHGVRPTPRAVAGPGEELFVAMYFEAGHCTLTTYRKSGELVGSVVDDDIPEGKYEYRLYETATKYYPQQPAAGFELLRFGRVLGTENTLTPADAPHWRKVAMPNGKLWVNLNGAGIIKLSDADLPHWLGWRLVDASNGDARCRDDKTLALLPANASSLVEEDLSGYGSVDSTVAPSLADEDWQKQRFARTVAKFLTEWDHATLERRQGWLKHAEPDGRAMDATGFGRLERHVQALSFWSQAKLGMDSAPWHFEPRQFILHFKKCGWLSLDEMTQMLPRLLDASATQGQKWRVPSWQDAERRFSNGFTLHGERKCPSGLNLSINRAFRTYRITTPLRQAHFLAQMLVETGLLTGVTETGDDRYFRTMYEVLTSQEAGEDFDHRHEWLKRLGFLKGRDRPTYLLERPSEVHKKAVGFHNIQPGDGPRFRGRGLLQITGRIAYEAYGNYRQIDYATDPRPILLATDAVVTADVSGWFWTMKTYRGDHINACADKGIDVEAQKLVTRAVNGGLIAWGDRHALFNYVWSVLNEEPNPEDSMIRQRQKTKNKIAESTQ